jgi:hypothetical protein
VADRIRYYVDLLISLCGFDGSEGALFFGWIVTGVALLIVIYAFYVGITKALWPGETDPAHIKYRILDDSDEEQPYAH